jgi:ribulose-phosphate 3-epimerase
MKRIIIPAIIAKSQEELNERLEKVKPYADLMQLDVMDGLFVPNHSLDFDFTLPSGFRIEAHLMINNPEQWIDESSEKVDTILVHVESCKDPGKIIQLVKGRRKIGFALNPETPLERIRDYLHEIDQLLVMTVNPGFYGSKFLPETLEKVKEARKLRPDLDIEVDGGIDLSTIRKVSQAGANMFVSGSYLMKSKNVKEAMDALRNKLKART